MNIMDMLKQRLDMMTCELVKISACQLKIQADLTNTRSMRFSSPEVVAFCHKNGVENNIMINILLFLPLLEREKVAMASRKIHPALLRATTKWWSKNEDFEKLDVRTQRLIYYLIMDCQVRNIGDKVWVWSKENEKKRWVKGVVTGYGKAHATWKVRLLCSKEIEVADKGVRNGLLPRPHKRVIMRSV